MKGRARVRQRKILKIDEPCVHRLVEGNQVEKLVPNEREILLACIEIFARQGEGKMIAGICAGSIGGRCSAGGSTY